MIGNAFKFDVPAGMEHKRDLAEAILRKTIEEASSNSGKVIIDTILPNK